MKRSPTLALAAAGLLFSFPAGAQSRPALGPPVTIVAVDSFHLTGVDAVILRTAHADSGDIVAIRRSALNPASINAALDELLFLRRQLGNVAAERGLYRVTLHNRPPESLKGRDSARTSASQGRRDARAGIIMFMLTQGARRRNVQGVGEGIAMKYQPRLDSDTSASSNPET